jgi:hypothetical protein
MVSRGEKEGWSQFKLWTSLAALDERRLPWCWTMRPIPHHGTYVYTIHSTEFTLEIGSGLVEPFNSLTPINLLIHIIHSDILVPVLSEREPTADVKSSPRHRENWLWTGKASSFSFPRFYPSLPGCEPTTTVLLHVPGQGFTTYLPICLPCRG